MRINFGHCIGCDQPIRPPYLSFVVQRSTGAGNRVTEWEPADVCSPCAAKMTASDIHRLVSAPEPAA